MKKLRCKIGLHKWSKERKISSGFYSNVYDVEKHCILCGKRKNKVIPK
jgi:hypothetical protein